MQLPILVMLAEGVHRTPAGRLDYLVESAPDHRAFRQAVDRARTRYVPGLVLAELDIRLRDGSSFDLVVQPTDPDRS